VCRNGFWHVPCVPERRLIAAQYSSGFDNLGYLRPGESLSVECYSVLEARHWPPMVRHWTIAARRPPPVLYESASTGVVVLGRSVHAWLGRVDCLTDQGRATCAVLPTDADFAGPAGELPHHRQSHGARRRWPALSWISRSVLDQSWLRRR
jgi:hypothetical protein